MPLPLQLHTRPAEGLVIIWDAEPGVARYAFIIGIADAPAPEIDEIMQGRTREFAMMGIPTRFTGAVDIGTPAGEERQYGLFAYKADGSLKPVANLRFIPARNAPRDREYHPLLPPSIERDKNRPKHSPTAKPLTAQDAPTEHAQAQSTTPQQAPARPADPWDLLDGGKKTQPAQDAPRQPAGSRDTTPAPPVTPPDPWAALDQASPTQGSTPPTQQSGTGAAARREMVPDPWDIAAGTTELEETAPPPPPQRQARAKRVQVPRRPAPLVDPWDELELVLRLNPDPDTSVPAYYKDPLAHLYARERAEAAALGLPLPTYLEPEAPPAEPIVARAQAAVDTEPVTPGASRSDATPIGETIDAGAAADVATAPDVPAQHQPVQAETQDPRGSHGIAPAEQVQAQAESQSARSERQAATETPVEPERPQPRAVSDAGTLVIEQEDAVLPTAPAIDPIEAELRAMWAAEEAVTVEPIAAEAVPLQPEPVSDAPAATHPQPTLFDLLSARYDLPAEYLQQTLPLAAIDRVARRLVLLRQGSLKDHGIITAGNHARRRAQVRQAAAVPAIPTDTTDQRPPLLTEPESAPDEAAVATATSVEPQVEAAALSGQPHLEAESAVVGAGVADLDRGLEPVDSGSETAWNDAPAYTSAETTTGENAGVGEAEDATPAFAAPPADEQMPEVEDEHKPEVEELEHQAAPLPGEEQVGDAQAATAAPAGTPEAANTETSEDEMPRERTAEHFPLPEPGLPPQDEEPLPLPPEDTPDATASAAVLHAEPEPRTSPSSEAAQEPPAVATPEAAQGAAAQEIVQAHVAPEARLIGAPGEEHSPSLPGNESVSASIGTDEQAASSDAREHQRAEEEAGSHTKTAGHPHPAREAPIGEPATTGESAAHEAAVPETREGKAEAAVQHTVVAPPLEPATGAASLADMVTGAGSTVTPPSNTEHAPEPAGAEAAREAAVPEPATIPQEGDVPKGKEALKVVEGHVPSEGPAPREAAERATPAASDQRLAGVDGKPLTPEASAQVEDLSAPPRGATVPAEDHEQPAIATEEQLEDTVAPEQAQPQGDVVPKEALAATGPAVPPAIQDPLPPPAGDEERAAPTAPEVAAMLDEAELYLLPQWADYAEVARILERVAALAPGELRLHALRDQLAAAQRGGPNIDGLLQEAQQLIDARDYWGAVDLYEQALAQQPGDERAGRGLERARLLARWSARLAGAGNDAPRLQQLGTEYAETAPDLAAQAFAEAFGVEATILSLRGWLAALVAAEHWSETGPVARNGLAELRRHERVNDAPAPEVAAEAVDRAAASNSREAVDGAVAAFVAALVANARRPHLPPRNEQHDDAR